MIATGAIMLSRGFVALPPAGLQQNPRVSRLVPGAIVVSCFHGACDFDKAIIGSVSTTLHVHSPVTYFYPRSGVGRSEAKKKKKKIINVLLLVVVVVVVVVLLLLLLLPFFFLLFAPFFED